MFFDPLDVALTVNEFDADARSGEETPFIRCYVPQVQVILAEDPFTIEGIITEATVKEWQLVFNAVEGMR